MTFFLSTNWTIFPTENSVGVFLVGKIKKKTHKNPSLRSETKKKKKKIINRFRF